VEPKRTLTVMVIPETGDGTRTFSFSYRRGVWVWSAGAFGLLVLVGFIGSWAYFGWRAIEARRLEQEVTELRLREERVEELARTLAEVEAAYERIRALFGADAPPAVGDLWIPPAAPRPTAAAQLTQQEERRPTSWPLTERGFVTQGLLEGAAADHPGIDIAIPAGSYVRAAGAGTVAEAGEDPVYGNYLVLDHGEGYRSLYAHASALFAVPGDEVRRNEVIALTGSSGRSTAPHLHFEVLIDGEPIDPLGMVVPP
jgi:murein DD-endopeptidase MepM/ murein hydrolase activator NlpD